MDTAERRVVAALWSLQGIGAQTIECVRKEFGAELVTLIDRPVRDWRARVKWTEAAENALARVDTLARVAEQLEQRLRRFAYDIVFPGTPAWPARLDDVAKAPAVLFKLGPGAVTPRRRVAMVGTRHPEPGVLTRVRGYAQEIAQLGIGVISGGAVGVDQAAHGGALRGNGETWAFLGCAIDQIDDAQRVLVKPFRDKGGTLFTEYPPLTRPQPAHFQRRNRLISGSADAVVILRAGVKSGALHTARYARDQKRRLLAMPGDPWCEPAMGTNALIARGAKPFLCAQDVVKAVGLKGTLAPSPKAQGQLTVSALAQRVLGVLAREAADFDVVLTRCPDLDPGHLTAALLELELAGAAVQRPGRRYERTA